MCQFYLKLWHIHVLFQAMQLLLTNEQLSLFFCSQVKVKMTLETVSAGPVHKTAI